ncbi:MAG: hypothetical protein BWY99_02198 [Synergistetes bacterium ADurb.BinA166]|nr:MAG: hypothetical protein BWY99_02198 [Synergistetes bacterium ADurb.BinA166]
MSPMSRMPVAILSGSLLLAMAAIRPALLMASIWAPLAPFAMASPATSRMALMGSALLTAFAILAAMPGIPFSI